MSFDIFFQRVDGRAGDTAPLIAVLAPLIERREHPFDFAHLRTDDGEAHLYGMSTLGQHVAITHASGRAIWDVMYELARVGQFVVIPIGCGTCVPPSVDVAHVPPEYPEPITVVRSGQELLDWVESC